MLFPAETEIISFVSMKIKNQKKSSGSCKRSRQRPEITENLSGIQSCDVRFEFYFGPSANTEGAELMSCTAASPGFTFWGNSPVFYILCRSNTHVFFFFCLSLESAATEEKSQHAPGEKPWVTEPPNSTFQQHFSRTVRSTFLRGERTNRRVDTFPPREGGPSLCARPHFEVAAAGIFNRMATAAVKKPPAFSSAGKKATAGGSPNPRESAVNVAAGCRAAAAGRSDFNKTSL